MLTARRTAFCSVLSFLAGASLRYGADAIVLAGLWVALCGLAKGYGWSRRVIEEGNGQC